MKKGDVDWVAERLRAQAEAAAEHGRAAGEAWAATADLGQIRRLAGSPPPDPEWGRRQRPGDELYAWIFGRLDEGDDPDAFWDRLLVNPASIYNLAFITAFRRAVLDLWNQVKGSVEGQG